MNKQAYALRKIGKEYDEISEGPVSKGLDYAGKGALLGGATGAVLGPLSGFNVGDSALTGGVLGAGVAGGGRGLYEIINRNSPKESRTDEMTSEEKIDFLKNRGLTRTLGAGAYGLGYGAIGMDQFNQAVYGDYRDDPKDTIDPRVVGIATGLAAAGLEANQSRKRVKKLREKMKSSSPPKEQEKKAGNEPMRKTIVPPSKEEADRYKRRKKEKNDAFFNPFLTGAGLGLAGSFGQAYLPEKYQVNPTYVIGGGAALGGLAGTYKSKRLQDKYTKEDQEQGRRTLIT